MYFQDSWEQWMWMQYIHGSDSGSRRSVFVIIIFLSVSNFAVPKKLCGFSLGTASLWQQIKLRAHFEGAVCHRWSWVEQSRNSWEAMQYKSTTIILCSVLRKTKSHQWGTEWLTGWLVDHVLVNLRNGFQRLWWRCLAPCPSLKFWFRQFNPHPFVLSLCAQLLHPLVFPACSSHLLKLKWIAFPAKQGIRFDLEGFTEERMEIWAN